MGCSRRASGRSLERAGEMQRWLSSSGSRARCCCACGMVESDAHASRRTTQRNGVTPMHCRQFIALWLRCNAQQQAVRQRQLSQNSCSCKEVPLTALVCRISSMVGRAAGFCCRMAPISERSSGE